MNRIADDISKNFRRLVRLIRREGLGSAFHKGWPYLKRRAVGEFRLMRIMGTKDVEERFTKIYQWNFWEARESASGPGSGLHDTETLRRELPSLFKRFAIRTILDAPCGDFHWMKEVVAETDIVYVGGDIVRPMIESNVAKYASARITFLHLDVRKGPLPKVDLWFCRDLFYHLSLADIRCALDRFVQSGIPYVFASHMNVSAGSRNFDISSGDYRPINLFEPPFSLPRDVLYRINDCAPDVVSSREMCLWSRDQLATSLAAVDALTKQ